MKGFISEMVEMMSESNKRIVLTLGQRKISDRFESLIILLRIGETAVSVVWRIFETSGSIRFEDQTPFLNRVKDRMPNSKQSFYLPIYSMEHRILMPADRMAIPLLKPTLIYCMKLDNWNHGDVISKDRSLSCIKLFFSMVQIGILKIHQLSGYCKDSVFIKKEISSYFSLLFRIS